MKDLEPIFDSALSFGPMSYPFKSIDLISYILYSIPLCFSISVITSSIHKREKMTSQRSLTLVNSWIIIVLSGLIVLFLHFLTSLIQFIFGSWGRPRSLKIFYNKKQACGGGCGWAGVCPWRACSGTLGGGQRGHDFWLTCESDLTDRKHFISSSVLEICTLLKWVPFSREQWEKTEHRRIDAFELWCWRTLVGPFVCKEIK